MFDMKMFKQVQQMQKNLMKVQEELAQKTVEASAGGGVVKVVVAGNQEIKQIILDPSVVDANEVEMLQDLILAAINEGMRLAKEMSEQEIAKVTAGLNLPGMPKLF